MLKLLIGFGAGWGAAWLWREWSDWQTLRRARQTLEDVQAYLDTRAAP